MTIWTKSKAILSGALSATIAVAGAASAQECKNPDVLRFSMIPTEETTQELSLYQPLVNQLKEATGKPIEFYLPTSYASVVEAMLGGFVDIGMHGPYSYVIAREKDPNLMVVVSTAKQK